jgi:hypothetical protein
MLTGIRNLVATSNDVELRRSIEQEGLTWKAVPFGTGSSSPAGSPAQRKRASQSAIEL